MGQTSWGTRNTFVSTILFYIRHFGACERHLDTEGLWDMGLFKERDIESQTVTIELNDKMSCLVKNVLAERAK